MKITLAHTQGLSVGDIIVSPDNEKLAILEIRENTVTLSPPLNIPMYPKFKLLKEYLDLPKFYGNEHTKMTKFLKDCFSDKESSIELQNPHKKLKPLILQGQPVKTSTEEIFVLDMSNSDEELESLLVNLLDSLTKQKDTSKETINLASVFAPDRNNLDFELLASQMFLLRFLGVDLKGDFFLKNMLGHESLIYNQFRDFDSVYNNPEVMVKEKTYTVKRAIEIVQDLMKAGYNIKELAKSLLIISHDKSIENLISEIYRK